MYDEIKESIRKILFDFNCEVESALSQLQEKYQTSTFEFDFERACGELELELDIELAQKNPLLFHRIGTLKELAMLPDYPEANDLDGEIPSVDDITKMLSDENFSIEPEVAGLTEEVLSRFNPPKKYELKNLSLEELRSYQEGTPSPRLEKIIASSPELKKELDYLTNPEKVREIVQKTAPNLEAEVLVSLQEGIALDEEKKEYQVVFKKEEVVNEEKKDFEEEEISTLKTTPISYFSDYQSNEKDVFSLNAAATMVVNKSCYYSLQEKLGRKFFVELRHSEGFEDLYLCINSNEKDSEHLEPVTVDLLFGEQEKYLSKTIFPAEGDLRSGFFALKPELPLLKKPILHITLKNKQFKKSFQVEVKQELSIQNMFENLEDYHFLGNSLHVLNCARRFWELVISALEKKKRYDFFSHYCFLVIEYLPTHLHQGDRFPQDKWQELRNHLISFRKIISSWTGKTILTKLDKLIVDTEKQPIAVAEEKKSGRVCALCLSSDTSMPRKRSPYGIIFTLEVTLEQSEAHYISPRFQGDITEEQIQESFKAVAQYLQRNGLKTSPIHREKGILSIDSYYLKVVFDGTADIKLSGKSLGLPCAIAYFSCILSQAYEGGEENPFALPEAVAATGNVTQEGKVGSVGWLQQKLEAFSCEYPNGKAYISKERKSKQELETIQINMGNIYRATSLEEIWQNLFGKEKYQENLQTAIAKLNQQQEKKEFSIIDQESSSTQMKSLGQKSQEPLPGIFLYYTVPLEVKLTQSLKELKNSLDYDFWEQESEEKLEKIKKAWLEETSAPNFLEIFGSIESNRLTPYFKREYHPLRMALPEEISSSLKLVPDSGSSQSIEAFQVGSKKSILTLGQKGQAFFTCQVKLPPVSLDTLVEYSQSTFQKLLKKGVAQAISSLPFVKEVTSPLELEPYLFIVAREDSRFNYPNIDSLLDSETALIYSLLTGAKREQISATASEWLKGQNQTTRADVYMAVNEGQAILIELPGRREKFTCSRLAKGKTPSPQLIEARETYNDINYLLWLEILMTLKQEVCHPEATKENVERLYELVEGKLVARHTPYKFWIDDWKKELGIPARYKNLPHHKGLSDVSEKD